MTKIIKLTLYKFNYPIAFEISGIKVMGITRSPAHRCVVNDIEVTESFDEVIYMLEDL